MNIDLNDLSYHRRLGCLIGALDKSTFWPMLVRAMGELVSFDNWVVLRFSTRQRPVVYIENPNSDGTPDLLFADYLAGLYLFDPFFIASREQGAAGLVCLDEVAPEDFTSTDYYRLYFHRNIVADEVQFNCALDGGDTLCFSMGRGSKFTSEEIGYLSAIAHWVTALMLQRHRIEGCSEAKPPPPPPSLTWHEGVETAISKVRGTRLTTREVEVGQLMLSGFSAKSIASRLTISVETVKAHKKHIYAKLEINSQSELFAIFYQAQGGSEYT
ncbi:MAG: response regulator transcription factor [Telluria sp.]